MFNDETKVVSTESFDPLTDTGKVAQAVKMVREQIRQDLLQSEARIIEQVSNRVEKSRRWNLHFMEEVLSYAVSILKKL